MVTTHQDDGGTLSRLAAILLDEANLTVIFPQSPQGTELMEALYDLLLATYQRADEGALYRVTVSNYTVLFHSSNCVHYLNFLPSSRMN